MSGDDSLASPVLKNIPLFFSHFCFVFCFFFCFLFFVFLFLFFCCDFWLLFFFRLLTLLYASLYAWRHGTPQQQSTWSCPSEFWSQISHRAHFFLLFFGSLLHGKRGPTLDNAHDCYNYIYTCIPGIYNYIYLYIYVRFFKGFCGSGRELRIKRKKRFFGQIDLKDVQLEQSYGESSDLPGFPFFLGRQSQDCHINVLRFSRFCVFRAPYVAHRRHGEELLFFVFFVKIFIQINAQTVTIVRDRYTTAGM